MDKQFSPEATELLFVSIHATSGDEARDGVQSALAMGADPNAARPDPHYTRPWPVLEMACRLKEPWAKDLVVALLRAGASPELDGEGRRPLHVAAQFGDLGAVEQLLAMGHSARCATDGGWTPFLCAASAGRFEVCELLAPHSDVRAVASEIAGDASGEGRTDGASLLVDHGEPALAIEAYKRGWGTPERAGRGGITPLARAIDCEWDDLVDYLGSHPECDRGRVDRYGNGAMHLAARRGRVGHALALAKAGHPIDAISSAGLTPLARAIRHGRWDFARALLELGADPRARASHAGGSTNEEAACGQDALCVAAGMPWAEAFELGASFVDRCDPLAVDVESRRGALHMAASNEPPALAQLWVEMLLSKGWSATAQDYAGSTPLMRAMEWENHGAMAALLPVSDLTQRNAKRRDAMEQAQWLEENKQKKGVVALVLAHVERAALASQAPEAPSRSRSRI